MAHARSIRSPSPAASTTRVTSSPVPIRRSSSTSSSGRSHLKSKVPQALEEEKENQDPVSMSARANMESETSSQAGAGSSKGASSIPNGTGTGKSQSQPNGTTSPSPGPGPRSRSSKSPSSPYNGLPTLPTIGDDGDDDSPFKDDDAASTSSPRASISRPPPPAPSAQIAANPDAIRPGVRKRRSSSIKRKPSPGVVPQKAVDWEIPRKTLHSSIGLVTLFLRWMDPPTLRPLITVLSIGLVTILTADFLRLTFPTFAEIWEQWFGFLMRESERDKINGVVWYLVGVIFVLGLYPRDVAVVAILTLSWSDTTASTLGRLWGRYTPPLPPHLPLVPAIKFAPRKSLAGFLAATVTGFLITVVFFWNGSQDGRWAVVDNGAPGLILTSLVVGIGGAVVEALDLGVDDNLTLPILSGAVTWGWLATTNVLLS